MREHRHLRVATLRIFQQLLTVAWRVACGVAVGACALPAVGCSREPMEHPLIYASGPADPALPVYQLAIYPGQNPQRLAAAYQPLVDWLNRRLTGARVELLASRDYATYNQRFRARAPALLLANPWQALEAIKVGYRVLAMAGDAKDFKGIFIARRDSPVRVPADLKGKTVSYPAATALAACMMPQYYLHQHGIDLHKDIENVFVGSQESSILQAYLGKAAVGVTWPPAWREFQKEHPREAAQLKVLWETAPLVNNAVLLRDDVPSEVATVIRQTLLELQQTPEGQALLLGMETAHFLPAVDADYAPVRQYISDFERDVRKVEEP